MIENLILLTGEDDFRLRERLRFYRTKFIEKYPDGEVTHWEKSAEFSAFENTIMTPSLFGGKRLAVCEDFWDADMFEKATNAKFFERLPNFSDQSTLMIVVPKLDKRLKFTKFLISNAKTETFDPLDESNLLRWIEKYANQIGGEISRNSAEFLLHRVGTDLWNLTRELQKLITFTDGEPITRNMITEMTRAHPAIEIWDFLKYLSERKAVSAIEKFRTLLQMGQSPHQIFPMIQREVRVHALLRSGIDANFDSKRIAGETKLHPFVVSKTLPLTRNFSAEKLRQMYDALFTIDKRLKTGGMQMTTSDATEFSLAIERFIVQMCHE